MLASKVSQLLSFISFFFLYHHLCYFFIVFWVCVRGGGGLDRKPSLQGTLCKPKYENSTTQNVTPTTSNHHPCHRHELGAKDGPNS